MIVTHSLAKCASLKPIIVLVERDEEAEVAGIRQLMVLALVLGVGVGSGECGEAADGPGLAQLFVKVAGVAGIGPQIVTC